MICNTISAKTQGIFEFSKYLLDLSNIYNLKFKPQIMLVNREPTFKKGDLCLWQFVTEVFANIAEKIIHRFCNVFIVTYLLSINSKGCYLRGFRFFVQNKMNGLPCVSRSPLCEAILFEKCLRLDCVEFANFVAHLPMGLHQYLRV